MNYRSVSFLCSSYLTYDFMRVEGSTANAKHPSFPSVEILTQVKKLALRRGIWFRLLNRVERAIIDLTVKCVDKIKSVKLAKLLTAIIEKLQSALESIADRLMRTVGLPLARKICDIAVRWGNRLAALWAGDLAFARFLVVNFAKAG